MPSSSSEETLVGRQTPISKPKVVFTTVLSLRQRQDINTSEAPRIKYRLPECLGFSSKKEYQRRCGAQQNRTDIEVQYESVDSLSSSSRIDNRNVTKHNDTFVSIQSDYYYYDVDPFRWLLRKLGTPQDSGYNQEYSNSYIQITEKNPNLFAMHKIFTASSRPQASPKTSFLACARNKYDLYGYLTVKPEWIKPDLLYFCAYQACRIISVLNKAEFGLGCNDLGGSLQVWRTKSDEFQILLGGVFEILNTDHD